MSERTRVGAALDAIRDVLAPYVDQAMLRALGADWNDVVAEENARYRKSNRRYTVAKNDLAVLLPHVNCPASRRLRTGATEVAGPSATVESTWVVDVSADHSGQV